ncbi:MAG: hypothetical protein DVB31_13635 [Verrucomicrobia bacterium]|nr:MAG: hypothetical protein DVB31_13635 [Verrucomicrobiota bacterium]
MHTTNEDRGFALMNPVATEPPGVARARLVVAYDEYEAGNRTRHLTDGLSERARHLPAVDSSVWKFDIIGMPHMLELAVMDAVVADCVVIATGADGELPAAITDWIDGWVRERNGNPAMLMALIGSDEAVEPSAPVIAPYLGAIAARAGMKFVCHTGDWENSAALTLGSFLKEVARVQGNGAGEPQPGSPSLVP